MSEETPIESIEQLRSAITKDDAAAADHALETLAIDRRKFIHQEAT